MVVERKDVPQTFEAWMREHEEREKDVDRLDYAHPIYDVFQAIDQICFDNLFVLLPIAWIPEGEDAALLGRYGNGRIEINKAYYDEQGLSDDVICTLFHEMCHAFCDYEHIADSDGNGFHTEDFADAVKEHGGVAEYADDEHGYNAVTLESEIMNKIKSKVKRRGIHV